MNWISVEDRAPDIEEPALIYLFYKDMETAIYVGEGEWEVQQDLYFCEGDVTHWMPLPEPPE